MSDDEREEPPHDLSPYELLRLEKIRRNQAKLEALGLGGGPIGTLAGVAPRKKNSSSNQKRKKRSRPNNAAVDGRARPTRSSKRLRGIKEKQSSPTSVSSDVNVSNAADDASDKDGDNVLEADEDNGRPQVIDYNHLPQEPDQLDDDEFQVYTSLRAWRLRRKNELEVEPYKICQNRTLCELIRRVRNDQSWGALVEKKTKGGKPTARSEEDVAADLIECWGLGPSKVAGDGFGPEMMAVIAEEKNGKLLEASRGRSAGATNNSSGAGDNAAVNA